MARTNILSTVRWVVTDRIEPEPKDYKRAESMSSIARARAQANAIKDQVKLIRRVKAVLEVKGEEYAQPFIERAKEMGFNEEQMAGLNELAVLAEAVRRSIG